MKEHFLYQHSVFFFPVVAVVVLLELVLIAIIYGVVLDC